MAETATDGHDPGRRGTDRSRRPGQPAARPRDRAGPHAARPSDRARRHGRHRRRPRPRTAAEAPAVADQARARPTTAPPSSRRRAALADERLADLQRLQAEYVNYRRRVERDRDVARENAVAGVLEALLPVLDDLHLARQHGDLEGGPFAAIADKLETIARPLGLSRFGEAGEAFDPPCTRR